MNALAARRRHPAAIAILILLGLFLTGAVYAAVAPKQADATTQALPAAVRRGGQGALPGQLRLLPRPQRRGPGHRQR